MHETDLQAYRFTAHLPANEAGKYGRHITAVVPAATLQDAVSTVLFRHPTANIQNITHIGHMLCMVDGAAA